MLTGFISDLKSLTNDPDWRNLETFLRGLEPRYVLVSWDRVLLGVKNRLLYAASINIVADSVNEDNERIILVKTGTKPTGKADLDKWLRSRIPDIAGPACIGN